MTMAPPMQNTARPSVGESPMSTAPVAPGNPMCPSAWAANSPDRTTTKYPMTPAATATSAPAMNALRMNGSRRISNQLLW